MILTEIGFGSFNPQDLLIGLEKQTHDPFLFRFFQAKRKSARTKVILHHHHPPKKKRRNKQKQTKYLGVVTLLQNG